MSVWQAVANPNQRSYYYNSQSGESTYDKPRELWTRLDHALENTPWSEHQTDDGMTYWYNQDTQQSVWELPSEFSKYQISESLQTNKSSTEKFHDACEEAGLESQTFDQALGTLVRLDSFWELGDFSERRRAFAEWKRSREARRRREQIEHFRQELESLIDTLQTLKSFSWREAVSLADKGSPKLVAYAFDQYLQRADERLDPELEQVREVLEQNKGLAWDALRDLAMDRISADLRSHPRVLEPFEQLVSRQAEADHELVRQRKELWECEGSLARTKFVAKLEELRKAGRLTAESSWQQVVGDLETETKSLCGHSGSTPLELFNDEIWELRSAIKLQTGYAHDALTAKHQAVERMSFEEFEHMVKDDPRITNTKQVYDLLRDAKMAALRQRARQNSSPDFHKPASGLEY